MGMAARTSGEIREEGKRGGSSVGTTVDSTTGGCLGAGTMVVVVRNELVILVGGWLGLVVDGWRDGGSWD